MADRPANIPTDQPTNQPTNGQTGELKGKLNMQNAGECNEEGHLYNMLGLIKLQGVH